MKKAEFLVGCAIAGLVAGTVVATPSTAQAAKRVKCYGSNACGGKGACGGVDGQECAGNNSCKGQGWEYKKTKSQCTDSGGMLDKAKWEKKMKAKKADKKA